MSKQNKQSSFEKYYLSNLDVDYIASDLDRIERQRKRNADRRSKRNEIDTGSAARVLCPMNRQSR